jgi:hypothetical protein
MKKWIAIALFLVALPYGASHAFWSKYLVGALKVHQGITSAALGDNTFTFLTNDYSFDPSAIDAINEVHAAVDDSSNYFAAEHFDSESFVDAYDLLQGRRDQVMSLLKDPNADPKEVWNLLGYMLHAMQDFYSHSTYIADGNGTPVDFGAAMTAGTTPSSIVPLDSIGAVCNADGSVLLNNGPQQITTGYFDISPLPAGKCQHGKLWYAVVIGCGNLPSGDAFIPDGINHDHPCFSEAADIQIFTTAKDLATQESVKFVQGIVDELATTQNSSGFCLLLGLPADQPPCPPPSTGTCSNAKSCVNWTVGTVAFAADPCDHTLISNYCAVEYLGAVVPGGTGASAQIPTEISFSLLQNGNAALQPLWTYVSSLPLTFSGSTATVTVPLDANDPLNTTDLAHAAAFVGFPTSAVVTSAPAGYPAATAQFSSAYLQNNPSGVPGSITAHYEVVPAPNGSACQPFDTNCVVANVYASGSFSFNVDDPAQLVQFKITIGPHPVSGTFYFPAGTCFNFGTDQSGNPLMECSAG